MNVEALEDTIAEKDAQIKQLNGEVYMLMETLKRQRADKKVVESSLKKSFFRNKEIMIKLEKELDRLTKQIDKETGDSLRQYELQKTKILKEMAERNDAESRLLGEVQSELASKAEIKAEKEKYEREMADCQEKNLKLEKDLKEIRYSYM